jgi:hypothetical protein
MRADRQTPSAHRADPDRGLLADARGSGRSEQFDCLEEEFVLTETGLLEDVVSRPAAEAARSSASRDDQFPTPSGYGTIVQIVAPSYPAAVGLLRHG